MTKKHDSQCRAICRDVLLIHLQKGHVYKPGILAKASRLASKQMSEMAVVHSIQDTFWEMQIYDGVRREWLV